MSQELKTITYLGVALIAAITAFAVSREDREMTASDLEGTSLVNLEDPLAVKSLRIVKFDPDTGTQIPFEVAQIEGQYSIPSHENYPADARDHLADAVNFVNGVKILSSVSDRSGSHEDYGVVDPTDDTLDHGAAGAGTRITMSDKDGKPLADLIVGKEVKGHDGQYYVRYVGKAQVLTAELDPAKLSTKFDEWIERDLLKLDPLDLATVDIEDYSLETEQRLEQRNGGLQIVMAIGKDSKSDIELAYDRDDLAWKLEKLEVFEEGEPKVVTLAENEELNKTKLNDMKSALDDLEIADVQKKVGGFKGDVMEFVTKHPQAAANLQQHGFYFAPNRNRDGFELLSNNGQVTVGMSDGVQYVLRFGGIAGADKDKETAEDAAEKDPAKDDAAEEANSDDKKTSGGVLRYLFVMTQLQSDLIEKPELQEVPEETPPAETVSENTDEAATEKNADEEAEVPSDEAEPETTDEDGEATEDKDEKTAAEKLEEWTAKRDAIIKNNGRAEKEYAEKIEAAKKRVAELNERFSDWYYVISDETYHKIHLGYKDIIQEKKADDAADGGAPGDATSLPPGGLDQFNALKDLLPPTDAPATDDKEKQPPKDDATNDETPKDEVPKDEALKSEAPTQ